MRETVTGEQRCINVFDSVDSIYADFRRQWKGATHAPVTILSSNPIISQPMDLGWSVA